MQHAASHTTTVQPSSHDQRHVLIGKQWYQLLELIPTNDRTDTGNMRKNFGKDRTCSSGDMLADRRRDRQTDTVITILCCRAGRQRSNKPGSRRCSRAPSCRPSRRTSPVASTSHTSCWPPRGRAAPWPAGPCRCARRRRRQPDHVADESYPPQTPHDVAAQRTVAHTYLPLNIFKCPLSFAFSAAIIRCSRSRSCNKSMESSRRQHFTETVRYEIEVRHY